MTCKEIRKEASEACSHATAWLVLTTLIDMELTSFDIIVGGPYALGRCDVNKKLYNGEKFEFVNLFKKFREFGRGFVTNLLASIYTFLWSLLLIIPGIIKSYSYSMVFYLMNEDETLSKTDAITASRKLMKGHKWNLFVLELSYIGWDLLCVLTFGILSLWVAPKESMAKYIFFKNIYEESLTKTE